MQSSNRNVNKKIWFWLFLLLAGAGLAAMTLGSLLLRAVPDIQSAWADSSQYPYDFDRTLFSRTFSRVTAIGVVEKESVANDFKRLPGVEVLLVENQYTDVYSLHMEEGRFFREEDCNQRTAVINHTLAFRLFGYTDCVGEKLTYRNRIYDVIGVTKDRYTRYGEERYRMYIPSLVAADIPADYVGVAGISAHGNTQSRQDLQRFMALRYKRYETVDIVSMKQTLWFLVRLRALPVVIICLVIGYGFFRRKVIHRIGHFKERLQRRYLSELLPEIIGWSLCCLGIFTVVFFLLKMMVDQWLVDLLHLGQNFHIAALEPKALFSLFIRIRDMTERPIQPDELLMLKDGMTLITLSIGIFYLASCIYFILKFVQMKQKHRRPILPSKDRHRMRRPYVKLFNPSDSLSIKEQLGMDKKEEE